MFTYLQRKLGIFDLHDKIDRDHREKEIQWEVVTARWQELYRHLKQMEGKKVSQPEKTKPADKKVLRQTTLEFYDRIFKHLPRVKSVHLATLAERLKCSPGRVSGALFRLMVAGKVERTSKGFYRQTRKEGDQ